VGRQQRARFEGELRTHRHAALDRAPNQLVVGDIGDLEGAALLDHVLEELGAGGQVRLDRARLRELARQFGELLGRERLSRRAAARADQAVLGAERLDLRLRFGHAGAQVGDVVAEPGRGVTGGIDGGGFQRGEVEVRHRVGAARGEFGIARAELDGEDARLSDRIDQQVVEIAFENAILGRTLHRRRDEAQHHQRAPDRRAALGLRIEFGVSDELQAANRFTGDVARHRHLHLAGDGLLVDRLDLVRPLGGGAGEGGVAAFQQNLGFSGVARGHHLHEDARPERGDQRRHGDPAPGAAQDAANLRNRQSIAGATGPAGRRKRRIGRQPEARHGQSLRRRDADRGDRSTFDQ